MNQRKGLDGFTLIELLIVIAIVAILCAMAAANYADYVTRSKLQEPASLLNELRARLELYYLDNRHYGAAPACGIGSPTAAEARYFSYVCTTDDANALGGQTYKIVATGAASSGMSGFVFQIDQSNVKKTLGVPASKGWTLPLTDCWSQNKAGAC